MAVKHCRKHLRLILHLMVLHLCNLFFRVNLCGAAPELLVQRPGGGRTPPQVTRCVFLSMDRSRSPRRSLQCFVDAHLSSLHQRDRRALQHLRSQIQLVNQWRQVGVLAEAWELLKEQVLALSVDHPDTLNFRGTFQCLASDMSAIFDNATGQAQDAELALEYLISKLSDTCADQRVTSYQQHPNPILALQPGGQTRFRTSTEPQRSGPNFFFFLQSNKKSALIFFEVRRDRRSSLSVLVLDKQRKP